MLTRCPYKDCSHQWEFLAENASARSSNGFYRSHCPKCERRATLKPIEIWEQLERKVAYLGAKGCLSGGPSLPLTVNSCSGVDPQTAPIIETNLDTNAKAGRATDSATGFLPPLHVVLEDIRSLHNVGSIFRTSDAFGFRYLHLCGITGTPDRKDVKKTSLSSEGYIEWKYHMSGIHAVSDLKALGVKIISLECSDTSIDISDLQLEPLGSAPLCLVLGNEVSGVSEEILAASDLICHIPMRGIKESLNVSVAFGVAAFSISNLLRKAYLV